MDKPTGSVSRLVFEFAQNDNFDEVLLHYEIEVSGEDFDNGVHLHRATARAQLEGYFETRAFDERTPAGRTLAGWIDKGAMRAQRDDEVVRPADAPVWDVPVSAMASLSTRIKVRAHDAGRAEDLARQVAANGYFPTGFSLDDAAYVRASDFQVAEPERVDVDDDPEDDGSPAGGAIAAFKRQFRAFGASNEQLISEWEAATSERGASLDEAHWEAVEDIKGQISEGAANASSDDPADHEAAIPSAEEWVSSNISQQASTVALVLFTKGVPDGVTLLRERLQDAARRRNAQRAA